MMVRISLSLAWITMLLLAAEPAGAAGTLTQVTRESLDKTRRDVAIDESMEAVAVRREMERAQSAAGGTAAEAAE